MGVITPKGDLILKVLSDFDLILNYVKLLMYSSPYFKYLINNKFN